MNKQIDILTFLDYQIPTTIAELTTYIYDTTTAHTKQKLRQCLSKLKYKGWEITIKKGRTRDTQDSYTLSPEHCKIIGDMMDRVPKAMNRIKRCPSPERMDIEIERALD